MKGDTLAAGAARATFASAPNRVTEDKWKEAIGDFDKDVFIKNAEAEEQAARDRKFERLLQEQAEAERLEREREKGRGDADAGTDGDVGFVPRMSEQNFRIIES